MSALGSLKDLDSVFLIYSTQLCAFSLLLPLLHLPLPLLLLPPPLCFYGVEGDGGDDGGCEAGRRLVVMVGMVVMVA